MTHRTVLRNRVSRRTRVLLLALVAVAAAVFMLTRIAGCGADPETLARAREDVREVQEQVTALENRLALASPEEYAQIKDELDATNKVLAGVQATLATLEGKGVSGPEVEQFLGLLPPQWAAWGGLVLTVLSALRARSNRLAGREAVSGTQTPRAVALKAEAVKPNGFKMPL